MTRSLASSRRLTFVVMLIGLLSITLRAQDNDVAISSPSPTIVQNGSHGNTTPAHDLATENGAIVYPAIGLSTAA